MTTMGSTDLHMLVKPCIAGSGCRHSSASEGGELSVAAHVCELAFQITLQPSLQKPGRPSSPRSRQAPYPVNPAAVAVRKSETTCSKPFSPPSSVTHNDVTKCDGHHAMVCRWPNHGWQARVQLQLPAHGWVVLKVRRHS